MGAELKEYINSSKWGYLAKDGDFVVKPSFYSAGNFLNGRAIINSSPSQCAGIDSRGKALWTLDAVAGICRSEQEFKDRVKQVTSRLAGSSQSQCFLFARMTSFEGQAVYEVIDSSGRLIWQDPPTLTEAVDMSNYLSTIESIENSEVRAFRNAAALFVSQCEKYGMKENNSPRIRHTGRKLHRTMKFSDGLAYFEFNDSKSCIRKMYITETGELAFELDRKILATGDFYDGLAPACVEHSEYTYNNKPARLGFINKTGQFVIKPIYYPDTTNLQKIRFREGICTLQKEQKFGGINHSGEEVLPFKYILLSDFHEGLCAVFSSAHQ
jgi:hypothetical protein